MVQGNHPMRVFGLQQPGSVRITGTCVSLTGRGNVVATDNADTNTLTLTGDVRGNNTESGWWHRHRYARHDDEYDYQSDGETDAIPSACDCCT
jgi:hypothetical protein